MPEPHLPIILLTTLTTSLGVGNAAASRLAAYGIGTCSAANSQHTQVPSMDGTSTASAQLLLQDHSGIGLQTSCPAMCCSTAYNESPDWHSSRAQLIRCWLASPMQARGLMWLHAHCRLHVQHSHKGLMHSSTATIRLWPTNSLPSSWQCIAIAFMTGCKGTYTPDQIDYKSPIQPLAVPRMSCCFYSPSPRPELSHCFAP